MAISRTLSDWEVYEAAMLRNKGWSIRELAFFYRSTEDTIRKAIRKVSANA